MHCEKDPFVREYAFDPELLFSRSPTTTSLSPTCSCDVGNLSSSTSSLSVADTISVIDLSDENIKNVSKDQCDCVSFYQRKKNS